MQKYKINNNFFYKEIALFFVLYLSLILSFILSENSTGGAIVDYYNQKNISRHFANDFYNTLLNYDNYSSRHSPILIILQSYLEKLYFTDNFIRLLHLHLSLFLPYIFFKIIREKANYVNKNIALILSSLIFLSPTFRSLSIWPDSRLLGLMFFSLSILFYLKFINSKKYKFAILNVLTCIISSYISPNFSVFSLFFLLNFTFHYGFFSKEIFVIVIINIMASIPAFYYIFILDVNFLNKAAAVGGLLERNNILFINIFNNILITFSIIFFYLIPFLFTKVIEVKNVINLKNILLSILIFSVLAFNFNYEYDLSGGGILFKVSYFLFKNNFLFFIMSFISILFVLPILRENKINVLIFLLIILNNPQYTIYHKYFDPFLLISFFSIFIFNTNLNLINSNKNIFYIFSFFLSFLIISVYK